MLGSGCRGLTRQDAQGGLEDLGGHLSSEQGGLGRRLLGTKLEGRRLEGAEEKQAGKKLA